LSSGLRRPADRLDRGRIQRPAQRLTTRSADLTSVAIASADSPHVLCAFRSAALSTAWPLPA